MRALALGIALTAGLAHADGTVVELKSLSGLNAKALRAWLDANLASLAGCARAPSKEPEVVSVQAEFSTSPDAKVLKVDAARSDVVCIKNAVEQWKNDGHQPRAGPFKFELRFRSR